MAPDGSSGPTPRRATTSQHRQRQGRDPRWYGATNGIANKDASPTITQMTNIAERWKAKFHDICATGVKRKQHPAVRSSTPTTTTLWTYDME